jgi:hypothetical protein
MLCPMTTDSDQQGYPLAQRLGAVLGLVLLAGLAFIMIDVATGGRLTGSKPCEGCEDD